MIDIHILNKNGSLDPFIEIINEAFNDAVAEIKPVLPIDEVDVVFIDNRYKVIPELGIGGEAPSLSSVLIHLDPKFKNLSDLLYKEIRSTLAHELHHCAREKACGSQDSLWEKMILEGLAGHFDIQINGGEPKMWDKAVSAEDIPRLLKLAEKEYDDPNYNYYSWFFGDHARGIARWAGYSLGFHIVGKYLELHPETTAAKLYNVSANEFRKVI